MTVATHALWIETRGSGVQSPPGAARTHITNTALTERTAVTREENRLLAALPESDYRWLRPDIEYVRLTAGQVLFADGETVAHAYFPVSSVISLMTRLENGTSTGIALVGNEGLIGVSLVLEGQKSRGARYRAVVQNAGYACRIPADSLLQVFQRGNALRRLLLVAAQAQITQIAQFAVCNRFHTLSKRLCSWLLHSIDRLSGNELFVTQNALSSVLGVRRECASAAERHLRCAGVIERTRGRIHVVDRLALEQRACECYAAIARECARLALRL